MNAINKITTFVKTLGRDTRGEDLTEKSSGLSNAGKVVMAAVCAHALPGLAGAGAIAVANRCHDTPRRP